LKLERKREKEKSAPNCQKIAKMANSRKNITTAAPQINHSIKTFPVQNEINSSTT
jgi:nitrate reductase cytochrome c-type subunit